MAVRKVPTGLPVPRVKDAGLQRFLEAVIQRLGALDANVTEMIEASGGGAGGGTTTITTTTPSTNVFDAPFLDTPPKPSNVEAIAGIGIVMVSWDNPFRIYSNHGNAKVYRHTADQFDQATEIGQATWLLYPDTSAADETTFYYWVRWVSSTDVEGPISDGVSATTASDPEDVYENLLAEINADPLTEALRADVTDAQTVNAEIRRVAALLGLVLSDVSRAVQDDVDGSRKIHGFRCRR